MPKYRVEFHETISYEVEFETDVVLGEPDADGVVYPVGNEWFLAMDAASPDWSMVDSTISDRELDFMELVNEEEIPDAT